VSWWSTRLQKFLPWLPLWAAFGGAGGTGELLDLLWPGAPDSVGVLVFVVGLFGGGAAGAWAAEHPDQLARMWRRLTGRARWDRRL
jgi:hypothetical protein